MNLSYLGTERTSTSRLLDSFPLWIDTDLMGVPIPTASGGKILMKHGSKGELTLAGVPKTWGSCTFVMIRGSEERCFSSSQVLSACQALENSKHLIVLEHSHRNLRATYYLITFLSSIAPDGAETGHPLYYTKCHVRLLIPVSENEDQSTLLSVRRTKWGQNATKCWIYILFPSSKLCYLF